MKSSREFKIRRISYKLVLKCCLHLCAFPGLWWSALSASNGLTHAFFVLNLLLYSWLKSLGSLEMTSSPISVLDLRGSLIVSQEFHLEFVLLDTAVVRPRSGLTSVPAELIVLMNSSNFGEMIACWDSTSWQQAALISDILGSQAQSSLCLKSAQRCSSSLFWAIALPDFLLLNQRL